MLEANTGQIPPPSEMGMVPTTEASGADAVKYALGAVRRQILIVVLSLILGLSLGGFFLFRSVPNYAATATLLIDTRKIEVLQQPAVSAQMSIESSGAMESQVEILKSEQIALVVIKKLGLAEDPRFIGTVGGGFRGALLDKAYAIFGWKRPERTDAQNLDIARGIFAAGLTANRIGNTYAIEIGFESKDAELAAQVANAVAEAYVDQQLTSQYDATRQASEWLETRLQALRDQSAAAQRAVVEYKAQNKLVETNTGTLVDDQRLVELNGQLDAARAKAIEAGARLDQLDKITHANDADSLMNASVGDVKNEVLTKLRLKYLELANRESEWTAKYGRDHLAVVNLRNQMLQTRSGILDQFKQMKESAKSDFDVAVLSEASLKKELAEAVSQSTTANQAQVTLRQLEASARAYQELYNTLLNRYATSLQQETSPVAEARIITPASPPAARNYKKTIVTAVIFPVVALLLGAGVALLRETLAARVFLTSRSVESALRMVCIGILPTVKAPNASPPRGRASSQAALGLRSLVRGDRSIGWTAADHPFSRFTEGLRSIKLVADGHARTRSNKIIGFTSAIPNEGKSTVALAFGQLVARTGARVIVVDCDLRNPSLTRSIAPGAQRGILQLMSGKGSLEDVVWTDRSTQMDFLPALVAPERLDSYFTLASDAMKAVFEELRKKYEVVVVDLSPLAPVIDVSATTQLVDSYVLVVEWGVTKIEVVEQSLRSAPEVHDLMLGAMLNKVDVKRLAGYDPHMTRYYGNKLYEGFGYTEP